jgi:hypothetical protein
MNAAYRRGMADLMDVVGRMVFGDDSPSDNTGIVIGGLEGSNVAGQMKSVIAKGAAIWHDAALWSAETQAFGATTVRLESDSGLILIDDDFTDQITHTVGDGTHDRIDLIWVKAVVGTEMEISAMRQYPSGTAAKDIFRKAAVTVGVTEGTPAGSPVAPAAPADVIVVAQVTVAQSSTDNDSNVYTDVRPGGGANWETGNFQEAQALEGAGLIPDAGPTPTQPTIPPEIRFVDDGGGGTAYVSAWVKTKRRRTIKAVALELENNQALGASESVTMEIFNDVTSLQATVVMNQATGSVASPTWFTVNLSTPLAVNWDDRIYVRVKLIATGGSGVIMTVSRYAVQWS